MKFKEFDAEMRRYEEFMDITAIPNINLVVRLDGRGFTSLTKELEYAKPFDINFRDNMGKLVQFLMKETGFTFSYGYTQSDEISLLFHPEDNTFNHKLRKINSTLAGAASAFMSIELDHYATFDCRVIQLPRQDLVEDYFLWRQEDANRNALNAYTYWSLRAQGLSARAATSKMNGLKVSEKNELLFSLGINYNQVELWQKRGIGFFYNTVVTEGWNPHLKQNEFCTRRRLETDYKLPIKEEYRLFIRNLCQNLKN